jgi:CBS-domain-containing membrane protein
MVARDVMSRQVLTVAPETSVSEVARLLLERRISAAPVVDAQGRLAGIVSEGDLMTRPETGATRRPSWWLSLLGGREDAAHYVKAHGSRAADVMTREVVTVTEDTPLGEVARLLEERRIKRVPVVRRGKLVGIVSRADLLRGLASARPRPTKGAPASDRSIQEKLVKTLVRQEWAPLGQINVIVTNGVVHLWGLVESPDQRRALRVAAERIAGVRDVQDHLGEVPPYLRGT